MMTVPISPRGLVCFFLRSGKISPGSIHVLLPTVFFKGPDQPFGSKRGELVSGAQSLPSLQFKNALSPVSSCDVLRVFERANFLNNQVIALPLEHATAP